MVNKKGKEPDERIFNEYGERIKELAAINQTTQILKEGMPIEDSLHRICLILPEAWQHPEHTAARIRYDDEEFCTPNFVKTPWKMSQTFETIDDRAGEIEIYYLKEFDKEDEGPFLIEERHLINNLTGIVAGYLNSLKAKALLRKNQVRTDLLPAKEEEGRKKMSRELLQTFFNKQNVNRDVFHDLMRFKVREILLIANLYDAFSIEYEGRLSESILGEYQQLNLTSMPRITGVSNMEEANTQLNKKHFDLIIVMTGLEKKKSVDLCSRIKSAYSYIPIFLLVSNKSQVQVYEKEQGERAIFDRIFVWNGDANIFFAMVKHLEDKVNAPNDTQVGLVRTILLVEDNAQYYSRYLPLLYNIVLEQTRLIIEDVSNDDLYRVLKLRGRPKILLACNYEDALKIYNSYKDYMLCLISDVRFKRNEKFDEGAGFELVKQIRSEMPDLPVIMQSSEQKNAEHAEEIGSLFINKNSKSLLQEIRDFISEYLGFGKFVYRDNKGNEIAVAKTLKEFEEHLKSIPEESLLYHARRDHFSLWLMARGEIQIARIIRPIKVTDFQTAKELRDLLISVIQQFRNDQNRGKLVEFDQNSLLDEACIPSLSSGMLGGKGRGISFISTLLYGFDFDRLLPDINIRMPRTAIVGTDEFDRFMATNELYPTVFECKSYLDLRKKFLEGTLSQGLMDKLSHIAELIEKPIAVRSSGLFEDSLTQPFAGIFETYILPNSHPDIKERIDQLAGAIKMVYASVYSKMSRSYIQAVNYNIEDEKMAVVIQEVVGNQYDGLYYPHVSGVAQSYNYYPYGHMKPEEGYAVLAVGLGKHVVEGGKSHRFSPVYPDLQINSPKDQFKNSQVNFYAVDLNKKEIDLLEGETAGLAQPDIDVAEKHGNLKHCASVYNPENDTIVPGTDAAGPRIVNFANILKYDYAPLAKTLTFLLDVIKEAMGSPVEIEFALDLNKDEEYKASLYLLQIKPLLGSTQEFNIKPEDIDPDNTLLYSEQGMGNGQLEDIQDIIFVKRDVFDKSKTQEMAEEIEALNEKMRHEGRQYVLIGPGRWGTRDRWIGIPINWPQISMAKLIVETSLDDFPLDASGGSHFFHNVTSMNVGYCSVQHSAEKSRINWEKLDQMESCEESKYFRHVCLDKALSIKMDGKKRITYVGINQNDQ